MKKTILAIILMGASIMGFAQEDKVLMTINGEPVMLSEFMYIYEKNNQESSLEKKTMEEYLELFINFKLKVAEAIAQGVDTTEAFQKELDGYPFLFLGTEKYPPRRWKGTFPARLRTLRKRA